MTSLAGCDPLDLHGRRLLLTGGSGFVGRTLLDYLRVAGEVHGGYPEVWVLSRTPQQFLSRYPGYGNLPWLTVVAGDILDIDAQRLARSERWGQGRPVPPTFTDILHGAADTHAGGSRLSWFDQIVLGTRNLLDLALVSGMPRFLLLSSGAVYGPQPENLVGLPEDYPGAPATGLPTTVYGQAKRVAEHLCTLYRAEHGLPVVVARCFAFIGAHLPLDGPYAIGNFLRDALHGRDIVVKSDGSAVRSYLYGSDLAQWLLTLLIHAEPGTCCNVGSDQALSLGDLARRVATIVAPQKRVVIEREPVPGCAGARYVPDIARAAALGLRVETPLEVAIALTADFLRRV